MLREGATVTRQLVVATEAAAAKVLQPLAAASAAHHTELEVFLAAAGSGFCSTSH
jgi:hypothetical protein